jgi:hypothetical protein
MDSGSSSLMGSAGTIFQVYGSLKSARDAEQVGEQNKFMAGLEAKMLRRSATEQAAAGQRAAADERRRGELINSRAIALAAASGGSLTDPTIVNILASNAGETAYRSAVAIYGGLSRARSLQSQAVATEYGGELAKIDARQKANNYRVQALSDFFKSDIAGDLYTKYGGGGWGGWVGTQAPAPVSDAISVPVR